MEDAGYPKDLRSLTPPLRSRGHFRSEVPVQGEAGERDQARGHELHPLLLGAGLAAAAPQVMGTDFCIFLNA